MAYNPIPCKDVESRSSCSEDLGYLRNQQSPRSYKRLTWVPTILSCVLNLVLGYVILSRRLHNVPGANSFEISRYAGLKYDLLQAFPESTEYTSDNAEVASDAWERLDFDTGIVALDKDYAKEMGLPKASPFPWDSSKGLYLLNGYHSLHCIKSIHTSLVEFQNNRPQTFDIEHIMHCVDSLRIETMCQADDTPRFSTSDLKPVTGVGQYRQCRSWDKLESWAQEHTACYRYLNYSLNFDEDQLQRYRFCPPGSPYLKKVEKYFKLDDE